MVEWKWSNGATTNDGLNGPFDKQQAMAIAEQQLTNVQNSHVQNSHVRIVEMKVIKKWACKKKKTLKLKRIR